MDTIPPMGLSPAPQIVPDQRPTADAVATTRDPRPDIPLPMPPSLSQQATISAGMLTPQTRAEAKPESAPLPESQRTLKPFGVAMLPSEEGRPAAEPTPQAKPEPAPAPAPAAEAPEDAVR